MLQVFAFALFAFGYAAAQTAVLKSEDKIKIFDKVWETVNKKYYDPNFNGADWNQVRAAYRPQMIAAKDDAEFYSLIKQMVGELRDAHTSFMTPVEAELYDKKQAVGTGLQLEQIAGKIVVAAVRVDSAAAAAGIAPGSVINKIDGRDAGQVFAETKSKIKSSTARAVERTALRQLLAGDADSVARLEIVDRAGKIGAIAVARRRAAVVKPQITANRLKSGVGYIRFDKFEPFLIKPYKKALQELSDTGGLIIDLRANGGGDIQTVLKMAGMLMGERVLFGTFQMRTGDAPKFLGISIVPEQAFVGGADKQIYKNPIIVLTSERSASGSELFASGLQENNRAKIVGRPTCGCVLGVMGAKEIKNGELRISQINVISAKGKRYENVGVTPDATVELTLEDLQNNFDRALETADKMLNQNVSRQK